MPDTRKALEGLKGVTRVDAKYLEGTSRGRIEVAYDPTLLTEAQVAKATERANPTYIVFIGEPADVPELSAVDFRVLSSGGPFHLDEGLSKSKPTILDFGSSDDKACQQADFWLNALAKKHGVARRRVNVGDPKENTSAFQQMKRDFGVEKVPYVRLYAKGGALAAEFKAPERDAVEEALAKLR